MEGDSASVVQEFFTTRPIASAAIDVVRQQYKALGVVCERGADQNQCPTVHVFASLWQPSRQKLKRVVVTQVRSPHAHCPVGMAAEGYTERVPVGANVRGAPAKAPEDIRTYAVDMDVKLVL